ncbi:MAG TPA: tRNA (N6-isopentenyl adenosine(37)-C2)-methylthiotransferase MiaB [Anaerolineae bacterium]|jgi:tRNA-2-methylthio-N6-dimethylallyladenosine synthase
MKYHISTFGCQMNEADSQRLASEFEKLGLSAAQTRDDADVLVLNTCVVRQSAEDKAYSYIQTLKPIKNHKPDVVIGVMGCLVGVRGNSPLQKAFPYVDVFMAPSDPRPMIDLLLQRDSKQMADAETHHRFNLQDADDGPMLPFLLPEQERGKQVTAHVPIVLGCSHACTFCIIPFRRGIERSRTVGDIVADVRALVQQGVREVTLLGQIVDRYGYDLLGDDFAIRAYNPGAASGHPSQTTSMRAPIIELFRLLSDIEGLHRIRFLTSHPNWMTDELLGAIRELPKVMPHIEVPVQAGDDEVLLRMRRGYNADDYRALVQRIRARVPNAGIATDIIVGFCGETEAQFNHTYELLEELKLDVIHIAQYSTRPNTAASRNLVDDVPQAEKERRFRVLEEQQERIATQINSRLLNQTIEILVEDQHKGKWRGRTPSNKVVFFEETTRDWRGHLVNVKISWTGPWSMQGAIVEQQPAILSHPAV